MNLFRKAMAFFTQRVSASSPDGWPVQGTVSDSGESVSETSALALSAFWACRSLIAGTIASMPIMVYRTVGDERRVARDHPLWRVLHDSPNFDQTAVDCWDFISSSIELWGNGYARVLRNGSEVTGIVPIRPDLVSSRRLADGKLEYRWTYEGREHVFQDRDMLHIRGPGGDPLGGMSVLAFGRQVFGTARAADRSAAAMFRNGLRPSGVLQFKEWLTPEQRAIADEKLATKFLGAMNTGKPMMLEGGAEWRSLAINPEDAQMLESRAFSVEEICRFFGVPPFMVGHTEKSTSWGTGIEQQTLAFQKYTLRARLKRIEQAMMQQLLTPDDRAAGVVIEFNLEGLLRGDSKGRADFYQSGLTNGWLTINEVRRLENLAPVPGGDVPRMQMQNVPLADAGQQESIAP